MFTAPERILLLAFIVAAVLQLMKTFIPLLNGWGAVSANVLLSALAITLYRFELTWTMIASFLLIALTAAGIHGTATKISDHPSPHRNPTPSGTPAQNHKVHID